MKQYVEIAAGSWNVLFIATSEYDVQVPERAMDEDVSILGTRNELMDFNQA